MTELDRSLAPARTSLAWRRTGLGYAAVALVSARHGLDGGLGGLVLLALACTTAAAGLTLAWARSGGRGSHLVRHGGDLLLASVVALAASACTLLGLHVSR